jgi:hypothetical protein
VDHGPLVLPRRSRPDVVDHHRVTHRRALRDLTALPDDIGLLSLRDLVPTMSDLSAVYSLNLLALEALAAAVELEADVVVAAEDDGPKLRAAVEAAGLRYTTV